MQSLLDILRGCELDGNVTHWSVGRCGFGTGVFEEERQQQQQAGGRASSSHLRECRGAVGHAGKPAVPDGTRPASAS